MKISYAITVCNEFVEVQKLVTFLLENKRIEDEIVILFDVTNGDKAIEEYLRAKSVNSEFNWIKGNFKGHFADWKNYLTTLCSGDYIFQIDTDEMPHKECIETLPMLLTLNPDVDVMLVPRVNTVKGLTQDHIAKWRWSISGLRRKSGGIGRLFTRSAMGRGTCSSPSRSASIMGSITCGLWAHYPR